MSDFHIRTGKTKDLTAIASLFDAYRVFYEKESDLPGAKQFLSDRMHQKDSEIFIAESANQQLVGFVQLYPLFSSTLMKRFWLLNDLFVDPQFRGKGISIALIERAKQLCRDSAASGMMLETAKTNHIGNQLYPRAGFVLDNDHHFYAWDTQ